MFPVIALVPATAKLVSAIKLPLALILPKTCNFSVAVVVIPIPKLPVGKKYKLLGCKAY